VQIQKILVNKNIKFPKYEIFWKFKRFFDLLMCTILFPIFLIITVGLFFLNIFINNGPVFYIQKRMGRNCEPFYAIKFRTMETSNVISRKYYESIETDRITPLGAKLRKLRLDELPQILNVFKGEMSLIGPRPDYYEHAITFVKNIPNYRERHLIKPGISGLSQIRLGYAVGLSGTAKKTKIDIFYIKNAGFCLDAKIFFGTIKTIIKGLGI